MDVPQQFLFNYQIKRFIVFEAQDSEDGDFDVVFEIEGKKLYANKFILRPISTTFNSMLSDRWTKPDEVVKIEGYKFEDFKEFLTYIYSGEFKINGANILAMVDIAEFYGIQELKDICEKRLFGMLNLENIHQMIELACKYSLNEFKTYVNEVITKNLVGFIKADTFQSLQKTIVKELVEAHNQTWYHEELFEGIYKWAENRALENQKHDNGVNIYHKIKEELSEILPLIKFERMNYVFFIQFVAKKSFLFSGDNWNNILLARKIKLFVKVTNGNGKIMKGEIQCDDIRDVANVIHSIKDECCAPCHADYCYWGVLRRKPSTPSKIIKNDKIKWYLVYVYYGELVIKRKHVLEEDDYLLAEMCAEDGFELCYNCKIETFSCA